jgi:hypothetical protein
MDYRLGDPENAQPITIRLIAEMNLYKIDHYYSRTWWPDTFNDEVLTVERL